MALILNSYTVQTIKDIKTILKQVIKVVNTGGAIVLKGSSKHTKEK